MTSAAKGRARGTSRKSGMPWPSLSPGSSGTGRRDQKRRQIAVAIPSPASPAGAPRSWSQPLTCLPRRLARLSSRSRPYSSSVNPAAMPMR
jgi:hypothetical protein